MNTNKINHLNYWTIPSVRRDRLNPRQREAIANEIIHKVCVYYNVSNMDVRGKKRYRMFVLARHMAMFFIKKKLNMKLKAIADMFGRDHTTVIHGITSIQNQSDTDVVINTDIENLNNIL